MPSQRLIDLQIPAPSAGQPLNTSALREKQSSLEQRVPLGEELERRLGSQPNVTFGGATPLE